MGRRDAPSRSHHTCNFQSRKAGLVCGVGLKTPGPRDRWPRGLPSASSAQDPSGGSHRLAGRPHQQAHLLWLAQTTASGLSQQAVTSRPVPQPGQAAEPPQPAFIPPCSPAPTPHPPQQCPPNSGTAAEAPRTSKRSANRLPGSLGHDGHFAGSSWHTTASKVARKRGLASEFPVSLPLHPCMSNAQTRMLTHRRGWPEQHLVLSCTVCDTFWKRSRVWV